MFATGCVEAGSCEAEAGKRSEKRVRESKKNVRVNSDEYSRATNRQARPGTAPSPLSSHPAKPRPRHKGARYQNKTKAGGKSATNRDNASTTMESPPDAAPHVTERVTGKTPFGTNSTRSPVRLATTERGGTAKQEKTEPPNPHKPKLEKTTLPQPPPSGHHPPFTATHGVSSPFLIFANLCPLTECAQSPQFIFGGCGVFEFVDFFYFQIRSRIFSYQYAS